MQRRREIQINPTIRRSVLITKLLTGLPPGGDYSKIQFKTCKRAMACKKCENCLKEDCMRCKYCEDRNKNGGKGNLKKVCV